MINLRDLSRYNTPERANDEEEWESESDDSDDIYSSSDNDWWKIVM